MKLKLFPVTAV